MILDIFPLVLVILAAPSRFSQPRVRVLSGLHPLWHLRVLNISLRMSGYTFDIILGSDINDEQLRECANLFSNNYGIYSSTSPKAGELSLLYLRQ